MKDEINKIHFGVYSSDEIVGMCACEVDNVKKKGVGSVYDSRMGVTESNVICQTCNRKANTCPGHFGYVKLASPIIHPLFIKHVIHILNCMCFNCFKCLVSDTQLINHNITGKKYDKFIKITKLCKHNNYICCRGCSSEPIAERSFKLKHCTADNVIYKYENNAAEGAKTELTAHEIFMIFDNLTDHDVTIMGLNPVLCHPRNYIMFYLLILPPVDRPYICINGSIWDDDITIQYMEIVKINDQLKTVLSGVDLNPEKFNKLMSALKFRIFTTFNNSQGKSKHTTNGRPIKGIKERLAGKDGQIRNNMMGKRCNFSARTVIGPDATLRTDELIVPAEMATVLTIPVRVTKYNISLLQKDIYDGNITTLIKDDKNKTCINIKRFQEGTILFKGDVIIRNGTNIPVKNPRGVKIYSGDTISRNDMIIPRVRESGKEYALEVGMIVNRYIRDGDWVLLNRQPTLHRGSMLAMKILIKKHRTIRMNLSICKTFNADFDGDEMNFHVPQGVEAQAELELLSGVEHHIISPQSSKSNIAIVQDSLLGAYKMTSGIRRVTKAIFFNIFMNIRLDIDVMKRIRQIDSVYAEKGLPADSCYSGKGLFSLFLPEDFNYEHVNNADPNEPCVKIEKGVLFQGAIDKSIIGSSHSSIIQLINKEYSPKQALLFVDCVQFCATHWLLHDGFTVGFNDCLIVDKDQYKKTQEVIQKCYIEASAYKKTTTHPVVREIRIKSALNKAKDVGLRLAKESLASTNNFMSTVISGSKGDFFNISQITGLLGQQDLCGQRVPYKLSNGRRSLPHYPITGDMTNEVEYESRGFISSSFIKGLNPREFMFHAMSGREGITDTAMGTATSGYIQRKIVKLTEDINVQYDGTVRDHTGRIYQYIYGDNNIDPIKTTKVRGIQQFCNIARIVSRLNTRHEMQLD